MGFICVCLPAVNALITHKAREYSSKSQSNTGYEMGRYVRETNDSKGPYSDIEPGSDKATLVSHAQADPTGAFETSIVAVTKPPSPDRNQSFEDCPGIMKTVDVSHTVTYISKDAS
jgi:hypothetical protein